MPPKPPTKSKYEQSLDKVVAGSTALRVNTAAVDPGSSSKYSVVIYSTGRYAGQARLLEWTPDGSRIANGRTISIEEANRLGGRGSAPRENIDELRRQVENLRNLRPNAQGVYVVGNRQLTKAGLDAFIKPMQDRLSQLESEAGIRTEEARQRSRVGVSTEIARVNKVREQLTKLVTDFRDEANAVETPQEQSNLNRWAAYYQAKLDELGDYVTRLDAGTARIGDVSTDFQQMSFEQAGRSAPATAQPQVSVTGPGMYGQMPSQVIPSPEQVLPDRIDVAPVRVGGEQSRMPTLDEVNRQRASQGLPALVVRGGQVVDPTTGQNVPNVSPTPTGQPSATAPTVTPGGAGGGAVGGTPTGTAPPAPAAPGAPVVPASWEQAAREQFGAYYEVVKNIPEVMKIIERDMTVGLSDAQFQAELEKTTWWRTTTASARAWEEDKARDPATVQTRIDNQLAALRDTSLRLGLRLRDDVLAKLAEDSLKFGWSNNVIQNAIGSEALRSTGGVSDLRRGYIGQTLRATAGSYGVPLSDVTFNEWVGKIATGQENEASFQAYALDLAKNLYPSLAASLDKGISFRAITDPYRQAASRILEINPETVDFADPKWAQAFTARNDKGEQMMMTYGEWNDYLRTNPTFGYEYTDGAKERAFTVANRLAELFGAA